MAVHDTEENGRTALTEKTLRSIDKTVDLTKHQLIIIDNGSCESTKNMLEYFCKREKVELITNEKNVGTANAINQAWRMRKPGQHCIKMDNDVVMHHYHWVDEMEVAIAREPKIGIVGLKRKDLMECPWHDSPYFRSELMMLPHQPGERWIVAEKVKHVMGTCQMYSSALLDKIGYLFQEGVYGFDDAFSAHRCTAAGMINVFLPHIDIDHIDPGGDAYSQWKIKQADEFWPRAQAIMTAYDNGTKNIYYDGGFEK